MIFSQIDLKRRSQTYFPVDRKKTVKCVINHFRYIASKIWSNIPTNTTNVIILSSSDTLKKNINQQELHDLY